MGLTKPIEQNLYSYQGTFMYLKILYEEILFLDKPLIAIPLGDPAGIGPEIVVKAIANNEVFHAARCVIVGDKKIIDNAIQITKVPIKVNVIEKPEKGVYEEGILNLIDLDNVKYGGI